MMTKTFFQKYKTDLLNIIAITVIFFVVELLFGKYFINIMIDFGREAYFPELMLNGKLLYKDLFNLFGPLSYQINSFLYGIFGVNLSVLESVGCFCSILILYCTYFIARFFLSKNLSIIITLFILITCVFSASVFNFIFPYTYSLLYAYMFFLGAILSFLISLKNKKKSDLYLLTAYFLIGASISSKYEFIPFVIFLFLFSIFVYKQNVLKLFYNTLSLLIIPIICMSILIHQGVTIEDFLKNQHYLKMYLSSDSLHFFYSHVVGTLFSFDLFGKIRTIDFSLTLSYLIFTCWTYYALSHSSNTIKYLPESIIMVLSLIFTFIIVPEQLYMLIPYIIYILLAYKIIICIKNNNFDIKNDNLLLLLLLSIIAIFKTAFILDVKIYGSYTLTIPLITIIYFANNIVPKFNNKIDSKFCEKLVSILLIILSIATIQITYKDFSEKSTKLITSKGTLYIYPEEGKYTRELLKYIENNLTKNQKLMIIPEGVFINFVSGKDLKLYNYQSLMPPYIDTYGIENIINTIQKSKIDYIVINERDLREYNGTKTLCGTKYALNTRNEELKLCSYIKNNYELKKILGKSFLYKIYKLK